MILRNKVEGRVYSFRSRQECDDLGIPFPNIPNIVTCHMVLVLDWAPEKRDYVRVMTITSKMHPDGKCLPIAPTKKKPFPIQLRLQNGPEFIHWNMRIISPTILPLLSYLRIDSHFDVPLNVLKEVVDAFGNQLMLCFKHHGGIRHLRSHLGNKNCQNLKIAIRQVGNLRQPECPEFGSLSNLSSTALFGI